uniref:Xpo1 domain-containing protein n=1 Tax=Meloidogyne hapla TaxID=6305 RepID=A0A1I8C237_MELHA
MDNISLDSVYEAVNALNAADPSRNGAAIKWLEQFQKSIEAWTIADRILNEARSFDACFFAAQTLRNKLLYQMHELPSDSYVALRDSLLALLRILPEELYNRKIKIGENRRQEIELEMASETVQVLNILSQLCSSSDASSPSSSANLTKCVNCLASWLLNKQCPTEILAHSPLLHSVIGCLTQEGISSDLHDAATECLVNAFQLIDDGNIPPQQLELAQILKQGVLHTADAFRSAVRDEDCDKLINYTRLYAEHCEAFLTEIARHPGDGFGDLRALEMLQMVNDYHEYNLVEMSFNVWYRLSEYLYQCDEPDFDELREAFKPFVEKHILSLCRHCRIDSDSQEMLSERSELADFRHKAQESVRDVTFIIGSVDLLRLLMEHLNTSTSWDQMEAILFIISSFINNIVESENLVIPTLLDSILKLPLAGTHKQLLKTSAQLLGNLQDWLIAQTISAPTQGDSDYMVRTFEWFCTLFGFPDGCMALTVAESLEFLVERGWGEIQKRSLHERYLNILSGLILSIEKSQAKAQEMEKAAQHLLKASTYLINDLPSPQLCSFLELLSAKSIDNLEKINSLTSIPPDPQPSILPLSPNSTTNKENISDAWQIKSTGIVYSVLFLGWYLG